MQKQKREEILKALCSGQLDKKYHGKPVVVVKEEVYTIPSDDKKALKLFEDLRHRFPDEIHTFVYVPKPDVLWIF